MALNNRNGKFALALIIGAGLALGACSSLPFKPKPKKETAQLPESADEALPTPAANPDGTETIAPSNTPAPKKGFASKLARALGSDNSTPNVGPCPAVRVLYEASRFVEFPGEKRFEADGTTRRYAFEDVGFTGEINRVNSSCRYFGADPIDVSIDLDMALGKGPKAQGNTKYVKYWVSTTRKDVAPIARKEFTGEVVFPEGSDRLALKTPSINITIPRFDATTSGANFEIIVGFVLDDDQLEFNRNGVRFKVDAGAPK